MASKALEEYKTLTAIGARNAGWEVWQGDPPDMVCMKPGATPDAPPELLFIVLRMYGPGRRREVDLERLAMLEAWGMQVRVVLNGQFDKMMTVEQWAELELPLSPNTISMYKGQLRAWESMLETLSPDHPTRSLLTERATRMRARLESLGAVPPQTVTKVILQGDALEEHLRRLQENAGLIPPKGGDVNQSGT